MESFPLLEAEELRKEQRDVFLSLQGPGQEGETGTCHEDILVRADGKVLVFSAVLRCSGKVTPPPGLCVCQS